MTVKRYRKLPVEIDAVPWTGDNLDEVQAFVGNVAVPADHGGLRSVPGFQPPNMPGRSHAILWVEANKSWLPLTLTEWVAKDSAGFYPIKNEIFQKSYEEVPSEGA